MKNSILLIGNTKSKGADRLELEAKALGLKFSRLASYKVWVENEELVFKDEQFNAELFLSFDTYYFRGVGKKRSESMQKLAQFLHKRGKRVVERCLVNGNLPIDKFVSQSKLGLYKVPQSVLTGIDNLNTNLNKFTWPVVAKIIDSSMGQGVARLNSVAEVEDFSKLTDKDFLLQEYFEIDFDTRILVVGANVLGGYNRFKSSKDGFITTEKGGRREVVQLTERQIAAALEAAKLQNLEIAGVDLFMVGDEIYIIEVNASPQFRVFEKTTGINVAAKIVEYIS